MKEVKQLGLWCLTALSTTFQYPEKTTNLAQVTDKLYHISSTSHHEWDSNSQCW